MLDQATDETTLAVAFTEAGNAFWRQAAHEQRISREAGADILAYLADLRQDMTVLTLTDVGPTEVYEAAWDYGMTYYDAAYIEAARQREATLVSEDGGIHTNSPDSVTVVRVSDLLDE